MSAADLGSPYSFASLPRPLDADSGRILAAPVYGHRAGKKRKRHEVVVAIDGESVNIYNVQNQNLVTSYAVSPQTYLCCPPVSIHVRSAIKSTARRETYAVVKNAPGSKARRLLCIQEDVSAHKEASKNSGLGLLKPSIKLVDTELQGEIVGLDAVAIAGADPSTIVVAASADSGVAVYSVQDGQSWTQPNKKEKKAAQDIVRYSAAIDIETAKSSLLKDREDVAAVLELPMQDASHNFSALVCQIVSVSGSDQVRFYALKASAGDKKSSPKLDLQLLVTYDLQTSPSTKASAIKFDFHAPTSTLYRLTPSKLEILDLSATFAKPVAEIEHGDDDILDFSRTSSSSILVTERKSAKLYETFYGSTLASVSLQPHEVARTEGKKRKRDSQSQDDLRPAPKLSLISAFADLGLIIGLSERELQAFQFNETTRGSKRAKMTLLKDVLNTGDLNNVRDSTKSKNARQKWEDWKSKVDQTASANDISGLEDLVFNDKELSLSEKEGTDNDIMPENGVINEDDHADDSIDLRTKPLSPLSINKRKLLYILQIIFDITDTGLTIQRGSLGLLAWIARTGQLSVRGLRTALSQNSIQPGDIAKAIARFDGSFHVLGWLFSLSVQWELSELLQGLNLLLQSFRAPLKADGLLALPAPTKQNEDVDMTNDDAESQLLLEAEAAEHELDLASAFFDIGLQSRRHVLHATLSRLAAFSREKVIAAMRSALSHEDLFLFIELMRVELAFGGWTSNYVDDGDAIHFSAVASTGDDEDRPSDHAVKAIGDLLNCAVDAIGPHGWLVGLSGHAQQASQLIDGLSAEISACLQGCVEASTMAEFLQTVDKCSQSAHATSDGKDEFDPETQLLPLGGKFKRPILLQSGTGRGGPSRKDIISFAQQKSRTVGKYSIDRIRV